MNVCRRLFRSSLGLKFAMAVSGLLLVGFLLAHLSGNLLAFSGAEAFNGYAAKLKSLGPLLWCARIGLLMIVLIHIVSASRLTIKNRLARPMPYFRQNYSAASYASRTMPISGLIVFCFIVYHLAHYTLFLTHPEFAQFHDASGHHDAYRMLVKGFQNPLVSGFYIFGMLLLGTHLHHGIASMFQSVGVNHVNLTPHLQRVGAFVAWAIVLGFISIPVSVLSGVIALSEGGMP